MDSFTLAQTDWCLHWMWDNSDSVQSPFVSEPNFLLPAPVAGVCVLAAVTGLCLRLRYVVLCCPTISGCCCPTYNQPHILLSQHNNNAIYHHFVNFLSKYLFVFFFKYDYCYFHHNQDFQDHQNPL